MVARYNRRWEEADKSDVPLESIIRTYQLFNRSEGKASATIISWYADKLREFVR